MRVVKETNKGNCKVTVFSWNNKYLLKLEAGNYEQTYKISELDLTGDDDIINLVDDEAFMQEAMQRFAQMSQSFSQALDRL